MKTFIYFVLLFLPFCSSAQHVFTLDPEKDPIAHRAPDGTLQFVVPVRVLAVSIQEAIPQITEIQTLGLEKFGQSNYLIASGKDLVRPDISFSVAILLAETAPDEFRADNLVISCSSTGDCRECSLPPTCKCNKGEGTCGQNIAIMTSLKKVTVTLFD